MVGMYCPIATFSIGSSASLDETCVDGESVSDAVLPGGWGVGLEVLVRVHEIGIDL